MGQQGLDQGLDPVAVACGDGLRWAEPQGVKLGFGKGGVEALGLVDRQHHGQPRAAQACGDELVSRCEPGARIHHEQCQVRLCQGPPSLLCDEVRHFVGFLAHTPGVDDHERALSAARDPDAAVAGEAPFVRDQGVPGTRQAVEQGGFPDVGTPHDGDDRQHGMSAAVKSGAWRYSGRNAARAPPVV